jgi:hypothetical protein
MARKLAAEEAKCDEEKEWRQQDGVDCSDSKFH